MRSSSASPVGRRRGRSPAGSVASAASIRPTWRVQASTSQVSHAASASTRPSSTPRPRRSASSPAAANDARHGPGGEIGDRAGQGQACSTSVCERAAYSALCDRSACAAAVFMAAMRGRSASGRSVFGPDPFVGREGIGERPGGEAARPRPPRRGCRRARGRTTVAEVATQRGIGARPAPARPSRSRRMHTGRRCVRIPARPPPRRGRPGRRWTGGRAGTAASRRRRRRRGRAATPRTAGRAGRTRAKLSRAPPPAVQPARPDTAAEGPRRPSPGPAMRPVPAGAATGNHPDNEAPCHDRPSALAALSHAIAATARQAAPLVAAPRLGRPPARERRAMARRRACHLRAEPVRMRTPTRRRCPAAPGPAPPLPDATGQPTSLCCGCRRTPRRRARAEPHGVGDLVLALGSDGAGETTAGWAPSRCSARPGRACAAGGSTG